MMIHNYQALIFDPETEKVSALTEGLKNLGAESPFVASSVAEVIKKLDPEKENLVFLGDLPDIENAIDTLQGAAKGKVLALWFYTRNQDKAFIRSIVAKRIAGVLLYPSDSKLLERALRNHNSITMNEEVRALVHSCAFCDDMEEEDLEKLCSLGIPRFFPSGATILKKGEPVDSFFILLQGKVEAIVDSPNARSVTLPIKEGQVFGEMSIIDSAPRSAYCLSVTDTLVLEVGAYVTHDRDFPLRVRLLERLAGVLSKRLRTMNELVLQMSRKIRQIGSSKNATSKQADPIPKKKAEKKEVPASSQAVENVKAQEKTEEKSTPPQEDIASPTAAEEEPEAPSDDEEFDLLDEEVVANPFTVPTGQADTYCESVNGQEEYDVLHRKINLRTDFITSKIPNALVDIVLNKLYGYWTGGKLAKVNPHRLWRPKTFTPGTYKLLKALHLVVVCDNGRRLYKEAFLNLELSHRCVGLSQTGCVGTFLHDGEAFDRYVKEENFDHAIRLDFEIPIDRDFNGSDVIEFLTHTGKDVRDQTLFLIFDDKKGRLTQKVRKAYPQHQLLTVVRDIHFNPEEPSTIFSCVEEELAKEELLTSKKKFAGMGFYTGQTFFLPDFSPYYDNTQLKRAGYIFGTIGLLAQVGPDYSGIIWGSKGGAEGAVKAARAMFGIKGAQSQQDIASAINWADD